MPTPTTGESHDDFISRCIPIVIDDGTASDEEQAVAVCESLWDQEQSAYSRLAKNNGFKPLKIKIVK